MEFTVEQLAHLLEAEIQGDKHKKISTLAKIQEAQEGSITFLANPKYEPYIYTTHASVVVVNNDFVAKSAINSTLLLVKDAYSAFTKLLTTYEKLIKSTKSGIEQPSFIADNTLLGEEVYVGAFTYIGKNCKIGNQVKIYPQSYIADNVIIGDNTTIHAGVKIYHNVEIGENCAIHAGAVIGSDGFGFAPQADGTYQNIPQLGKVIIEDDVRIGANTVVDRATLGATLLQQGVKLDNLIQVGHNVIIGKNTVIAAQTGISGSAQIGENCMIGGQVGIVGHIGIANKTNIGAQSGVSKTIKSEGTSIQGSPAFDYRDQLKSSIIFRKLPEVQKQIEQLEEKILNLPQKEKN